VKSRITPAERCRKAHVRLPESPSDPPDPRQPQDAQVEVSDGRIRGIRGTPDRAALRYSPHAEARELAEPRRDRGQPLVTRVRRPRSDRDPVQAPVPHAALERSGRLRAPEDQLAIHHRRRPTSLPVPRGHYAWAEGLDVSYVDPARESPALAASDNPSGSTEGLSKAMSGAIHW